MLLRPRAGTMPIHLPEDRHVSLALAYTGDGGKTAVRVGRYLRAPAHATKMGDPNVPPTGTKARRQVYVLTDRENFSPRDRR